MQRIAVIGAGLAGVVLARHLAGRANVELFEKSRGPSGRLSTRRTECGFEFDHGAQFFTARDARFNLFLTPYLESGLVQQWKPRILTLGRDQKPYKRDWFEPHYVAVPSMNSLVKMLAKDLSVSLQREIAEVIPERGQWHLKTRESQFHGPYDWVISTCPANQTRALFPAEFAASLSDVKLQACFALLLGFETIPKTKWEAAVFQDSCLSWASWNNGKPGRSASPALVVLSDNQWAEEHIDDSLNDVKTKMEAELEELAGLRAATAAASQIHRWRYANASQPAGESYLLDVDKRLAACGDWCLANRVEAAFLSAARLANRLNQLIPHP